MTARIEFLSDNIVAKRFGQDIKQVDIYELKSPKRDDKYSLLRLEVPGESITTISTRRGHTIVTTEIYTEKGGRLRQKGVVLVGKEFGLEEPETYRVSDLKGNCIAVITHMDKC